MQAGKLDRRVTIQTAVKTTDAAGQINKAYAGGISVWAGIKYDSGSYDIADQQDTTVSRAEITIRYLSTLTIDSRILFENRIWTIENIQPIGRNAYQVIKAETRA